MRVSRFAFVLLLFLVSLFAFGTAKASQPASRGDIGKVQEQLRRFREQESRRLARIAQELRRAEAAGVQPSQSLDVLHYDLDLTLNPGPRTLSGTVTMRFSPTAPLSSLKMRLHKALTSTAATVDGVPASPRRKGADLTFVFSSPLVQGSTHEVSVTYSGSPQTTDQMGGGMIYGSHNGTPVAATLSEPFDSYAWWPCVDDVRDKSTMGMSLTVPAGMVGTSNGLLVETRANADGSSTFRWQENYPIANYLVAASVTDFAHFSDTYTSRDGTVAMPLEYYVYPEHEADARLLFARVPDMIGTYADLCGEYPFLAEKYGMVAFPWGGAMEHQTLTSMCADCTWGDEDQDGIYAHELSHQWWGDDVTCGTWNDIWLNEGFATFFEALWLSHSYEIPMGDLLYYYYDDGVYDGYLGGTVYVKNGNNPFGDVGAIYLKGAWVLHMLRKVMGEEAFWGALRDYRAAHASGNAITSDLRAACEARYGAPLDWFFDQWVYTPKRPVYALSFSQTGGTVSVTVSQKQRHKVKNRTTRRDVYTMPLDLTLRFDDGSSETRTVLNDQRTQTFPLEAAKRVTDVGLDEEHWVLNALQ